MPRYIVERTFAALTAALLTTTAWAVHAVAAGSTRSAATAAAPGAHQHPAAATTGDAGRLANQLAAGRLATAKYATNLGAAKAAGYQILTRMIPDMGWHFLNPAVQGFDLAFALLYLLEGHDRGRTPVVAGAPRWDDRGRDGHTARSPTLRGTDGRPDTPPPLLAPAKPGMSMPTMS
jgi:hypothetical protein